jgi:hypothetical protein
MNTTPSNGLVSRPKDPSVVDGVSVNDRALLVKLDDGRIARASASSFFIASFELRGYVKLKKTTFSDPSDWPRTHLRLPELDARG